MPDGKSLFQTRIDQPYPKGEYLKITCSAESDGSKEMTWSMVEQSSISEEAMLKIQKWEKRIRRLAAEKSSQSGDSLSAPRKIDKTKKLIAFSFDDGPARQNTDKVAKALAKNHVRATFFMLGQNVSYYPQLVKEVKDSGNEVAGHSWNHPQLTKLGAAGVCRQMQKMNHAISKVTGSNVGLLRPTYGAIDRMVKANINAPLIDPPVIFPGHHPIPLEYLTAFSDSLCIFTDFLQDFGTDRSG